MELSISGEFGGNLGGVFGLFFFNFGGVWAVSGVFGGNIGLFPLEMGQCRVFGVFSGSFRRFWGVFGSISTISGSILTIFGVFGGLGGVGGVPNLHKSVPPILPKPTCQILILHEIRPNTLIISKRISGGSAGEDPHNFGVLLETNLGPRNRYFSA